MEQWNTEELNSEELNIETNIERIREANKVREISLHRIPYLAFFTKYAPYSAKEIRVENQSTGPAEVFAEWESILSSLSENESLSKKVKAITIAYAGDQVIEEFESFHTTAIRRIKKFLDTLFEQKNCVKRFFPDGFSQLQANDLTHVLLNWKSGGFQSFCGGKYEKAGEIAPNLYVDIEDYIYDFIIGCLDDQINPQELSDLWRQRLEVPYEAIKDRLKEQVESELDNVKKLISTCIDPRPKVEDMDKQLKFLSRCIQLIGALEEKIIKRSSYMKRTMAEAEDKLWEEIRREIEGQ